MKGLININELKGILEVVIAIAGSFWGMEKYKRWQEKNKAKAGEITNEGLRIDNKNKKYLVEKQKIEVLQITITQLQNDYKALGERMQILKEELMEVYQELDKFRDENLALKNEIYRLKKDCK